QGGTVSVVHAGQPGGAGQGRVQPGSGDFLGHGVPSSRFGARRFLPGVALNEMSPGKTVKEAAGFQPESEPGFLLSSPSKENTRVVLVEPREGPVRAAVVKTSTPDIIKREVVTRRVLGDFSVFQKAFESPAAAAYTSGFFGQ